MKDKEFVVSHYVSGKGKEEKEKFTNHKAERHDEIVELLREQVQQLKKANEQLVHDNDILTDQLKVKDDQIAAAHQLADQAQKLHLGLEKQVKALTGDTNKPVVDGESSDMIIHRLISKRLQMALQTKKKPLANRGGISFSKLLNLKCCFDGSDVECIADNLPSFFFRRKIKYCLWVKLSKFL